MIIISRGQKGINIKNAKLLATYSAFKPYVGMNKMSCPWKLLKII